MLNIPIQYIFFVGALLSLAAWAVYFMINPPLRRKIVFTSLCALPFSLTGWYFIPAYWNPPTLFSLQQRFGFDIESIIFMFVAGGFAGTIYESVHKKPKGHADNLAHLHKKRLLPYLAFGSSLFVFFVLSHVTAWNPIYQLIVSPVFSATVTSNNRVN